MLNDSTRKTAFNTKWLFKVICFDVDEKPLGDNIRHNNFSIIKKYKISKDIETARRKNGNFRRHNSHMMPPITNIGITLISSLVVEYSVCSSEACCAISAAPYAS